jgi:hypothetical protein
MICVLQTYNNTVIFAYCVLNKGLHKYYKPSLHLGELTYINTACQAMYGILLFADRCNLKRFVTLHI